MPKTSKKALNSYRNFIHDRRRNRRLFRHVPSIRSPKRRISPSIQQLSERYPQITITPVVSTSIRPFSLKYRRLIHTEYVYVPSKSAIVECRNRYIGDMSTSSVLKVRVSGDLRPIVIDGCDIACTFMHSLNQPILGYLWEGVQRCIELFSKMGHNEIVAFVPSCFAKSNGATSQIVLDKMKRSGKVIFTPDPPQNENIKLSHSFEDRFMIQYAMFHGGIILSNDCFHDLKGESKLMDQTIENRVLNFKFLNNNALLFPRNLPGKQGQSLRDFLRF